MDEATDGLKKKSLPWFLLAKKHNLIFFYTMKHNKNASVWPIWLSL